MNDPESFRHFLNRECPRWDIRNNISRISRKPTGARFWFPKFKRYMTVEDYYFIQYGHDLRFPKGYVCRLLPAEYEEADCEIKPENLFPLEDNSPKNWFTLLPMCEGDRTMSERGQTVIYKGDIIPNIPTGPFAIEEMAKGLRIIYDYGQQRFEKD
ncbi:hypothetical protein CRE_24275 [Caenorhabditis remanei]|uniref:Uncharacterized protein n=1 Tax=Caenorhabditis remanei TaxID=31234 RepID=E3NJ35_CAERE|nr:hypothetical protein CRE_24275 [Caenorhabditis remanei]